jgi:hypothetical protein
LSSSAEPDEPVEPDRLDWATRLLQGIVFALASVLFATAAVIWKPLHQTMREAHLLGAGASPGMAILAGLAAATLLGIMSGRERGAVFVATGCMCGAFGLDFLPYSSVRSVNTIVVAASLLIVYATFRAGAAARLNPFVKLAYSVVGGLLLAVYIFNANSPYEEMHLFGGGAMV